MHKNHLNNIATFKVDQCYQKSPKNWRLTEQSIHFKIFTFFSDAQPVHYKF